MHIKLFEEFGEDAYYYPGIVLNLKQRSDGGLYSNNSIYPVSNYDYETGNPPLINRIPKDERTQKEKDLLKLEGYFYGKFNKLMRKLHRKNIKTIKIIKYFEDLGYEFKIKEHDYNRFHDNQIEYTTFFETIYEIDKFLEHFEKFIDIMYPNIRRYTKEDPYGEEDWD